MYELNDYLLISHKGEIVAVSGNTEFDDIELTEEVKDALSTSHCLVAKVTEVVCKWNLTITDNETEEEHKDVAPCVDCGQLTNRDEPLCWSCECGSGYRLPDGSYAKSCRWCSDPINKIEEQIGAHCACEMNS
jgi:hypothetical protein